MKKIVFTLITIILLVVNVSASTNCNVVSGTGKNIGDEIACGTEHFYVMESNNGNVKMMAKYNLYVGANYNKILLDITKTYIKYECAEGICNLNPEY